MCGRYKLTATIEAIQELFELAETHPIAPRYNIAPTQPVEIVRIRPGTQLREIQPVVWGLIPPWCQDISMGAKMINARSETIASKPAYRSPFKRRRCLIPTDGFYEWSKLTKPRQPYLIDRADGGLFAMAGLWEVWHGPNGEEIESCTIITTSCNSLIKPLHDRMPVIVPPELFRDWLETPEEEAIGLTKHLKPCDSQDLRLTKISTKINNARVDSADVAEPLDIAPPMDVEQQELF